MELEEGLHICMEKSWQPRQVHRPVKNPVSAVGHGPDDQHLGSPKVTVERPPAPEKLSVVPEDTPMALENQRA